jgi:hypothetical protein
MYKVGMTQNLETRLSQYQTYDPFRQFKVEHYKFVSDRRSEEKKILDMFAVDLAGGEWIGNEKVREMFGATSTLNQMSA